MRDLSIGDLVELVVYVSGVRTPVWLGEVTAVEPQILIKHIKDYEGMETFDCSELTKHLHNLTEELNKS